MYSYIVLDDNRTVVSAVSKVIENSGLPLIKAGDAFDGLAGLELAREEQPDIIITDIRMPGYDGLQLLEQLQEDMISCKCLIISGFATFDYAKRALQLGASDFLLKPVSQSELTGALEKMIAQLDAEKATAGKEQSAEQYSSHVRKAIRWVEMHIHEPVSLTDVSGSLGISASHLSRVFKKETQMGFNTFVTRKKMEEAQRLLQNPQNKVYEVADILGYRDYNYFFQVFKKTFGYAPKDERMKN